MHFLYEAKLSKKFSSSDISGPLPLGTVILPPRRPPRKRRRKISRCRSCSYLQTHTSFVYSLNNIYRSNSALELSLENFETSNTATVPKRPPVVHISPLVLNVNPSTPEFTPNLSIPPQIVPVIQSSTPQIQQLTSLNKRTFLAGLLEENNNLQREIKDLPSRKSSITESLREFESSLYEMLQENAEDERSENSLQQLPKILSR